MSRMCFVQLYIDEERKEMSPFRLEWVYFIFESNMWIVHEICIDILKNAPLKKH